MALKKRVRIIKKIRPKAGQWKFISMRKNGNRYVWDKRPGYFFVEWWIGPKRFREIAGTTPSEAKAAQRRKQNELVGELLGNGNDLPKPEEGTATSITDAITIFNDHVRTHSPDKPKTLRRYRKFWNTSSGTWAKGSSSKRSPALTLTTTRPNGRARRANSTPA